jgi:hypothetical protein
MKARLTSTHYIFGLFCIVAIILGLSNDTTVTKYKGAINCVEDSIYMRVKPQYIIEIRSEDDVLIQSEETVYKCTLDELQEVIEQDNL